MSFIPDLSSTSRLSEKLTTASLQELTTLILRVEDPISSNEALASLLELLVGGRSDAKDNYIIKEPSILLIIFTLLPHFTESLQLEAWNQLSLLLLRSQSNLHVCRPLRLLERCLDSLRRTSSERVANLVVRVLETVGSYHITLMELQTVLAYLYTNKSHTWAPHCTALLGALSHMAATVQPEAFFSFSGAPGAALTLPPFTKWPTLSGFTLNIWIRLERLEDAKKDVYKPTIYWLCTGRPELGYSAHFAGHTLVLETVGKSRKPQIHKVKFVFQPYQWYMLTVIYVHNRMRSCQLSCWVNGKPVLSADHVTLPATDDVLFDKCFLGSSPASTKDTVFQGQMSAVYLFKEPLGRDVVPALYKLGPGYKSQFNFDAESDISLQPDEKKILFDGRLSAAMVFSYNAKAVDGQLCLDTSPNENSSYFAHSPHASLLEGVSAIKITVFHNVLHSLGGCQVLIPLFSQMDSAQDSSEIDYSLCVKLLSLMFELARSSSSFLLQCVQTDTMELLGYLLGNLSAPHLSMQLLSCLFKFAEYLMVAPNGSKLLCQLIEHLIFNPSLWIRADKKVQMQLYSRLATEFSIEPLGSTRQYLRDMVDTDHLLFIIREYYDLVGEEETEKVEMHRCVRLYLLLIIKTYLTKGKGIQSEDMRALLDYLCSVPNEENLHDILDLLLALVFEDCHHPGNIVKLFCNEGGLNTAAKLLACTSEELTLNAMKLIGIVLHLSQARECQYLIETVELLAIIKEKLLSAGQPVTIAMFNTLFELLVDCPTRKVIEQHYIALESSHQIKYPRMLAVMVELVCSLHTSREDWEDGDTVMRIQLLSYVLSLCSQSSHNCKALLRLQHWQNWFLMLADQPMAKQQEQESLQELVYRLFHLMLLHALREEADGWRVWAETTATIHAYSATLASVESSEHSIDPQPLDSSDITSTLDATTLPCPPQDTSSAADDCDISRKVDSSENSSVSLTESLRDPSQLTNSGSALDSFQGLLEIHLPSILRSLSSGERSPSSPFLIPKNPFLDLVGKVPRFKWTASHVALLRGLFLALHDIIDKWKRSSVKTSFSEFVGDGSMKHLSTNVVHLLGLTADSILAQNGGLRYLLAHSSGQTANKRIRDGQRNSVVRRASSAGGVVKARSMLRLCMELAEVLVLEGTQKLHPVETRLRMEVGGGARLGLRLVLASASLTSITADMECRSSQACYYEEKDSFSVLLQDSVTTLQALGLKDSALMKYFELSCERKLQDLRLCQELLSPIIISHFKSLISRDKDNKVIFQQMVISVVYYLSVMCTAKYRSILSSQGQGTSSCSESGDSEGDHVISDSEAEETRYVSQRRKYSSSSLDISEQVESSMKLVGPFLCELIIEHKAVLSRVLVGADGRLLVSDAVMRLAESRAILEMTMLLCSQEWQRVLQKAGAKAFNELIMEGKKVAKCSESYLRGLASSTLESLEKTVKMQEEKFTHFEESLSVSLSQTIKNANTKLKLRRADVIRHVVSAKELWRKISSVMSGPGFFGSAPVRDNVFMRLDLKENCLCQHLQLLANPSGSTHEEAVRKTHASEVAQCEAEGLASNQFSLPSLSSLQEGHLSPEEASEELLESLVAAMTEEDHMEKLFSVQCCRVVLAYTIPGTLVLTKTSMAFTADDSSSEYEKALCVESYTTLNDRKLLEDITAILSRRYLHQNKALEIFFADRTSTFVVFGSSQEVGETVQRLPKVGMGAQFDLPIARSISLASPQQLFKKSTMTSKWERREISNFEYLMYLNILAGRTYNDLNQYPIFPWVLKDYSSPRCDLADPDTFRDLSKPVGALNPTRLDKYEERYNSLEDDSTMVPFFYGTHYSTMGAVLHWLVRVEPFSSLHIEFHDGLFDQSPRIFSSMQVSWHNSTHDTSDVNELVPEFFYLPEMFQNGNKFDFGRSGVCGEGEVIDDIKLPPWASSVHEFVHKHREVSELPLHLVMKALESEYVSSHLNHWIDLIFGYKQRGAEAAKAKNLFYHLTYTGSVDLETVEDAVLRKGLEDQIRNFGQTPAQLLQEPHPPRQGLSRNYAPLPVQGLHPRDPAVLAELQVTPDVPIALIRLSVARNDLLIVSCNQLYTVNRWIVTSGTSKDRATTVAIEPDKQIASGLRSRLGDPLDSSVTSPGACFTTLPSCTVIIVAGFWDNSFKCFNTNSGAMIQSVFGHRHIVSCVDFSAKEGLHGSTGEGLIATGSHDATVLLWRWSGRTNRVVGSLSRSQDDALVPLCVCTGHKQEVFCLSLSSSLGIVVSGAKHGTTLVHTLCGELLHNLRPSPSLHNPHLLCMTRTGHLLVHYADQTGCLAVYTCNGKLLSQCSLKEPALALAVTEDGRFLVSGGFDCTVSVYSVYNLQLCYSHPPFSSRIRSLHISKDQRYVFAGLASGSIVALSTHIWMIDALK